MTTDLAPSRPRALLVGVQLPDISEEEHRGSLAELRRLVTTLGYQVVGELTQKRRSLDGGTVVGEGKLAELASWTGGPGIVDPPKKRGRDDDEDEGDDDALEPAAPVERRADVVVVDHDLSPMQFKNLATAVAAEVLDRSGVIVEIFHRHASSREARLQVEMARLAYVAPRFRASAGGFDRAGGGVGAKGKGESQLELDRRKIRDRIAEIRAELETIEGARAVRRARRADANRVALVGYTNAGKSSWMRALTGSQVLVEDKLFATLDTTVRRLEPESKPPVLVSDTVGFIEKLPHDLVASFRSTLDEALEASLLLYVVDASDPRFRTQLEVTRTVMKEIGADDVPSMLVLNKRDRLPEGEGERLAESFRELYADVVLVSAKDPQDVRRLREAIVARFSAGLTEERLVVPYDKSALIGEIREGAQVVEERFEDDGIHYHLRAPGALLERIRARIGA